MMPLMPFPVHPCSKETAESIRREREILQKADIARMNVCVPRCIFSRSCGKMGQQVLDCEDVKKHHGGLQ